jgi:hypothetical protein
MGLLMTETAIVKQILDYLSLIHATAGKTKTMGVSRDGRYMYDKNTYRGFPDITGFHKGQIFFIEVKYDKNKQTPEQLLFQQHCKNAGITYILAYGLNQVMAIIKPAGIIKQGG